MGSFIEPSCVVGLLSACGRQRYNYRAFVGERVGVVFGRKGLERRRIDYDALWGQVCLLSLCLALRGQNAVLLDVYVALWGKISVAFRSEQGAARPGPF